ncbi:hypothetical protein AWP75_25090 [Escherichia coli]|uniref:Uncharacterized protein n=1 Tax=Escherichia coli TaxID=562 RepID=A0A854BKX7_ECOLX|nr:hypothetical protein AWP47_14695 [Escherichia coli]OKV24988.1 hypothetical protein AWP54_04785 [Escherichia coli]OKV50239.1 hypothetical protein AWP62_22055 [Escherichia coli]OKW13244.1 hypothetical protein AWP75_25090 [Escherichia coli]OKX53085.1 hypothetical protein AWP99_14780 [Escherichia coli]
MNSFVNNVCVIFITLFTRCHLYRNRHINTARAIAMGAIFKELLWSTPLLKKGVFRIRSV